MPIASTARGMSRFQLAAGFGSSIWLSLAAVILDHSMKKDRDPVGAGGTGAPPRVPERLKAEGGGTAVSGVEARGNRKLMAASA